VFITGDLQKLFEKVLAWLWQPVSAPRDEGASACFATLAWSGSNISRAP
jgi:hypothetical protein